MGMQVPGAKEAVSPVADETRPARGRQRQKEVLDLNEAQVVALTSFVSELPRPTRRIASFEADTVHAGERQFSNIGCADCHVRDLGSIKGMYSDQLLHDMGEATADVQATTPFVKTQDVSMNVRIGGGGGGYGASMGLSTMVTRTVTNVIPTRRTMEWKTPPLWGVRDSDPYFHDGRAPTLRDAIQMHDGEGRRSADEFRALPRKQQDEVVSFLESLTAPPTDDAIVQR
jgi:CxxC motif-containing protein (DUF1111 family)